jgi:hypothetical protein
MGPVLLNGELLVAPASSNGPGRTTSMVQFGRGRFHPSTSSQGYGRQRSALIRFRTRQTISPSNPHVNPPAPSSHFQ